MTADGFEGISWMKGHIQWSLCGTSLDGEGLTSVTKSRKVLGANPGFAGDQSARASRYYHDSTCATLDKNNSE